MPHLIVEYTDNLKAEADIPALLKKSNDILIAQARVLTDHPGCTRGRRCALPRPTRPDTPN